MSFAPPSAVREGPSHLPGVTRLTYSRDGKTIFTGGSDCMLRYHNVNEPDTEPGFFDEHRDPITCLATTSSNLLTGCIDGTTRSFDYPANEFAGNLARSSGVAVRWLAIDKDGEKVALCSDDLLVKIVNIRDPIQISVLPGLSRPVRSASWHTRQDMLTIITSDGKIQIYEFEDGNASCLKTIEAMAAPGKPDDELPCAVAWHPKGDYFVVPTRSHDIAIVDRDTWTRQGNFSASGHDGEIGLLAWSPNGLYLASSGKDDQIIVWETEGRQPVARVKVNGGTVTGLEFSPTDNALSWACVDGTFNTWTDPVPAEKSHPAQQPRVHATRQNGLGDGGEGLKQLDGEDDDDMGEDLADFDNDDWIVDDEDGGKYRERETSPNVGNGVREVVGITKAQVAFQPGSTAMRNKKRYLAFNMIGVVDVTDQDTHHVVNVEFHDKSADRRGYHFQDHNRFHLAAVGEQGIVYGSHADGDLPALVHYRAYDTWASGADWQVSLPAGEQPVLLAAGGKPLANEFEVESQNMGSVIVATSRGFIRFFTGSGVQRYLWRMGEEMVSMAASHEMAFLVHREGGTSLDGCQNLRYTLVDLDSYDIVQEGRIPLPKKTTLAWIGFSQSGAPAMYDSDGLLSLLDRSRRPGQARWSPLVDTRALVKKEGGNQTAYWPVGLTDKQMMCVILKGNEREPYFPRPVILDVDMTIPLLNLDISQGQLEEKLMQEQLQLNLLRDMVKERSELSYDISKIEVSQDKELIQLVQAACKADKLQRALDIVRMMNNVKSMEAAAKVAQFYHLPGLQEKIGIIREATEEKRREKERNERYGGYRMVARETPLPESPYGVASKASLAAARQDTDFAPRTAMSKRTARASVGAHLNAAAVPVPRYVSETPEPMSMPIQDDKDVSPPSPGPKRRRLNNGHAEEDGFKRPQPPSESIASEPVHKSGGLKNPFARKAPASNPFAKSNIANTTLAKKSYSFFDKVEDAEQAAKKNAAKNGASNAAKKTAKQTTLSLAPKAPVTRPSLQSEDSLASTVVDSIADTEQDDVDMEDGLEETQTDGMSLRASPEPLDEQAVADDDAEPLEWEDSDNEDAPVQRPESLEA